MGSARRGTLGWTERLVWIAILVFVASFRWSTAGTATTGSERVSTIPWRGDLNAALAEARQTGRPVLVDFSAAWCPPCIAMKHDVWPDAEVERSVTASYVPVQVDIDRNSAVSNRFGIESIPTILVLDGEGRVVRRTGFLAAPDMVRFLAGN